MTQEQIEYIKINKKWPLSIEYFASLFFLLLPSIFIYSGTKYLIFGNSIYSIFKLYSFIIIGLITFIWILIRINNERKFRKITLNTEHNIKEIETKLNKLLWITLESGNNKRVYLDKVSFFSYGVYVTIIQLNEKELLVNTKPFGKQPFTFYRDIINFNKIKLALN